MLGGERDLGNCASLLDLLPGGSPGGASGHGWKDGNRGTGQCRLTPCYKGSLVLDSILALMAALRVFFRSRADTVLEVLALRQQVAVLKRRRPRPTLRFQDRLFWTTLRRVWSRWTDVLVIVKPETVVAWRSRPRGGRPKITTETRALIRRLAEENPDCGQSSALGEKNAAPSSVQEYVAAGRSRGRAGAGGARRADVGAGGCAAGLAGRGRGRRECGCGQCYNRTY